MKKFVTVLTMALLMVMCTANVFAAANADVTYNDTRVSTTSYAVSVHTNGKATDGVVEISYDANDIILTNPIKFIVKETDYDLLRIAEII